MINFSMQFDEKKFMKSIKKTMVKATKSHIDQKIKNLCCPIHGQRAKLTSKGRNLNNLSWLVEGCCQEFKDSIIKHLK